MLDGYDMDSTDPSALEMGLVGGAADSLHCLLEGSTNEKPLM